MGNANILKTVFAPYCKMVFQGRKKGSKFDMFLFNKIKWVKSNAEILFLRSSL